MELKSFVRKPHYVNAVRVTEENMDEVQEYFASSGAQIRTNADKGRYIKIPNNGGVATRYGQAFPGDWLVVAPHYVRKSGQLEVKSRLRMYKNNTFVESFDEYLVKADEAIDESRNYVAAESEHCTLFGPSGRAYLPKGTNDEVHFETGASEPGSQ